jgi:hypothetical protein
MKKLMVNRCKCRICGDIIESKYRHDFVACSCGTIFTDGGIDYIRRGFKNPDDIIDMSEYWDDGEDDEKYPGMPIDADDWGTE